MPSKTLLGDWHLAQTSTLSRRPHGHGQVKKSLFLDSVSEIILKPWLSLQLSPVPCENLKVTSQADHKLGLTLAEQL